MKQTITYSLLAGLLLLSACKKDILSEVESSEPKQEIIETPKVPDIGNFNFNTTKDVKVKITLKANNEEPLSGVVVSVYLPASGDVNEAIFKGVTDNSGVLEGKVTVPSSVKQLIIDPAYVGLIRNAEAYIAGDNTLNAIIGGKEGFSGNIMPEEITFTASANKGTTSYKTSSYQTMGLLATTFAYPTGYTVSNAFVNNTTYTKALGRPAYLDATTDVLAASLLSYINASLPENQPLTTTHPAYLNSSVVSTINITAKTDIYVTFVSEGADQKNTLGYYSYTTGAAPNVGASLLPVLGGIDKVTWVFPNASAYGSGGGLKQGDRVKLGNFAAGTTIAFVMIKDGWNGTDVVAGNTKFYSNDSYNNGAKKQSVLLYDDVHKKFLSSFEDMDRSVTGSDNDFNDLVIYTTSSVANAISTTNVAVVDRGGDTDGDGVQDAQDAFPNDATRAYISYYPSMNTYGTIAFEDQWPKKGDYDMNDLVVGYRYTYEVNAQNNVVNLKADYTLLAAGTTYRSGFGVQLPVKASAVSSVTGQKIVSNYITLASNGVEAGQTNAVIIPFDNYTALLPGGTSSEYLNTYTAKTKVACQQVNLVVALTTPVALSSMQVSSFNPFLIVNRVRAREVHLAGYKPTDKADVKLFDTEDDATNPLQNKYYVSLDNKPFALIFNSQFQYPVEKMSIDNAYPKYTDWVVGKGTSFNDWYSSVAAGYRVLNGIYSK